MSRHHAVLSLGSGGVSISDDKSKYGTLVKLGSSFGVSSVPLPYIVQFGPGLLEFKVVDSKPRSLNEVSSLRSPIEIEKNQKESYLCRRESSELEELSEERMDEHTPVTKKGLFFKD